jgi:enterochelin esterase-like enzyme
VRRSLLAPLLLAAVCLLGCTQATPTPTTTTAAGTPTVSTPDPIGAVLRAVGLAPAVSPPAGTSEPPAPVALNEDFFIDPEFFRNETVTLPRGKLVEETFYSEILTTTVSYFVYLPHGYDADPTRRYPVVYMLHGIGGDKAEWIGYGLLQSARELMATGQIEPFIIVMPQGDDSYWLNHYEGPRWGDYLAYDVTAVIDQRYRTIVDNRARIVAGLSMGGTGALQIAFNYPDVFHIAAAHSPTIRTFDEALPYFGDIWHFSLIDPLSIARDRRVPAGLVLRIDAGDEDDWLERTSELSRLLSEGGIPHDFVVSPGWHDAFYWVDQLPAYLRFYDESFRQHLPERTQR